MMEDDTPRSALLRRADLIFETLCHREPTEAEAQARAMLVAALSLLQDLRGTDAVLDALSRLGPALVERVRGEAPTEGPSGSEKIGREPPASEASKVAAVSAEQLACATIDHLRTVDRDNAHERARGMVAGAAAYLHETLGRTHARAVLAGTLDAAERYGIEVRGGRDTCDTLH